MRFGSPCNTLLCSLRIYKLTRLQWHLGLTRVDLSLHQKVGCLEVRREPWILLGLRWQLEMSIKEGNGPAIASS
jgi:hypothetical protein